MCCGTETDRYCCIPSSTLSSFFPLTSSSSTPYQSNEDLDSYKFPTLNSLFSEKWLFIRMCTMGIFFSILLLMFVIIYLCLTSIRHVKRQKKMSLVQVPLPSTPPFSIGSHRSVSNRMSTITNASNDVKSRCTDTSIVLTTPLNLYPTTNSRNSTSSSSSYYIYPNELEYLCK